jgi:tetratricopeptide (TPR) repeat protein
LNPNHALDRIRRLIERGEHSAALQHCEELLAQIPGNPELLCAVAAATFMARDPATALVRLDEALHIAPGLLQAHLHKASMLDSLGDQQEALACYRRAMEVDPRSIDAHFGVAVLSERQGRFADAEPAYRACLDMRPELPPALLGLGNALRGQGRLDEARDAYLNAIALDAELVGAHNNLGNLYQEMEDYESARACYHEVVARVPDHANAWYNLGVCQGYLGEPEDAEEALAEARRVNPRDARILMNHGIALQKVERHDDALDAFHSAIARAREAGEGNDLDLMGKLASRVVDVYLQRGDAQAALRCCDAFLEQRPGDSSMLATRAVVLNDLGEDAALQEIIDWQHLVRPMSVPLPEGYASMREFNEALSEHVLNHPTLQYSPGDHATRNGLHTGDLMLEPKGPIADLEQALWRLLAEHEALIASARPDHPFLGYRPETLDLRIWGVVMHRAGHQIPHIHAASWVSGCYYPRVPGFVAGSHNTQAGWIEFARTPDWYHYQREVPSQAFPPSEGNLFLFPGYLWHRTIPFEQDAERISIAFDFVPGAGA